MHRFYLPPETCKGDELFLTGSEAHHALHVVRVRRGQSITVLDGVGHEFVCDVQQFDRDKIRLCVRETKTAAPLPCRITLLQALPKGKLFEGIVQKATELGATRIVPLLSERVVVHLNKNEATRKAAKWQLVAVEAIKQCGAAWLPHVEIPITPKEFLTRKEHFDVALVGSLQADAQHPRQYLLQPSERKSAAIWIGPEGDFTANEIEAIKASGAHPITLGPLVLRTETAATYCLSILNYEVRANIIRESPYPVPN
jgi:16S rRNA (uracil1498-N3)-methyltransferase